MAFVISVLFVEWKVYVKRSLIGFCVQMVVLVMVIATALLNLCLPEDHHEIWIYLLCTCLGVLFPNPKIKSQTVNSLSTLFLSIIVNMKYSIYEDPTHPAGFSKPAKLYREATKMDIL